MHPEFAPIAFLAASSLILPLPWHWRARNIATLCIIAWLFITNMIYGIDAVIWAGNYRIVIPVWCDITTKLIIGANVALPAACLCICIHLEQVSSLRLSGVNARDRRRRQFFELGMCIGLPLIIMALHYIVQGHRFDIIEDYGCRPTTYYSIPGIFLVWLPPILIAVASLTFAGLAMRHFLIRRLSFAAHLQNSNSALTTSRYFRLIAMSAVQMFWSIGATSYSLWFTVTNVPIRPWTTWDDVHSDWLRIDNFPSILTPPQVQKAFYVLWWLVPASTFLFVVFFSFGKDATDEYKKCISWVKVHVFRQRPELKGAKKGFVFSKPHVRAVKISTPTFLSSSRGETIAATVSLTPTSPTTPDSMEKSMMNSQSVYCETESEFSSYPSPSPYTYKQPRAIGSLSDLSSPPSPPFQPAPPLPEVIDIRREPLTFQPPPLSPPPSYPRGRGLILRTQEAVPKSPRPLTYPSHKSSHQVGHTFIVPQ
ncbi:pheromone A receptor-domain-containing protein [Panaeolus papilionaceus]|nr:pheromone A receptor-domain-containing protein [Panaeolus papilionaceus]